MGLTFVDGLEFCLVIAHIYRESRYLNSPSKDRLVVGVVNLTQTLLSKVLAPEPINAGVSVPWDCHVILVYLLLPLGNIQCVYLLLFVTILA